MRCQSCNCLQGVGALLTENEAENFPQLPNRNFKNEDIPWSTFLQSAKTCYCCDILLRGITGCFSQQQLLLSNVERVSFRFLYNDWIGAGNSCEKLITCYLSDGSKFALEFFTLEDDACPCPEAWEDVPTSTRTSAETSSEEAFEEACNWLENCNDEYHGDTVPNGEDPRDWISYCVPSSEAPKSLAKLPARVVDVGRHGGTIRLVEGNGQAHRYMCLSHCWGPHQIITTTKSTLVDRMKEIHTGELSKTFNDAILMTRRFGIDYIWIDSLCIVQDDAADWERESAKMASIYHDAYLTIAATRSSSGDMGLFAKTPDFEVFGTTPEGEEYYLVFREKMDHVLWRDTTTSKFPLMTRAWVFQERILSARVLHFGHHELFFECPTTAYCECGNIDFLDQTTTDIPIPNLKKMYSTALNSMVRTRSGKWTNKMWVKKAGYFIARTWRSLVMDYTSLHLTIPSDRLPALGGVAKTFAAKRGSPYLAGLFGDSLLDDLLWKTYNCKKHRLPEWRAPSWSWASIDTHVNYQDGIVYYDEEMFLDEPDERIEFASIDGFRCEPAGLDKFGRVKSASLRVTSQVLPVTLLLKPGLDHQGRQNYCVYAENKEVTPRIWPDYDLSQAGLYNVLPGTEVYCLRMIRLVEENIDMSLILRVVPTQVGRIFERIGFLQLEPRTPQIDCLEPEMRDIFAAALEKAEVKTVDII
ncbi:HET-domain-containing protein [Annulohypoxylon maeteangense]|uniref:HET-domain-containing protein n=1 Tax=Annulohypoxylon maeteangense TaxID=1927788 RepID=UPI0020072B20|nr:HET-domain-containing protein [Annulohypoxylon maeteangense]KAI0880482.1 HET-domain-containing protein [Annulohypoxylon maeteangense]